MIRSILLTAVLSGCASLGAASTGFQKQVLSDQYFCDGVDTGDLNGDGFIDIVAGPYGYLGPDFTRRLTIYPPVPLDPALSPSNSMFSFVHDLDRDGHLDVLVLGRVHRHQAFWYQNPGNETESWAKHFVFHRVKGESPDLLDFDGDGIPELLTHNERHWGVIRPDPEGAYRPWKFHPISEAGEWPQFYHGMGAGDLNQDGRMDILLNEGWYEQPPGGFARERWAKQDYEFSSDRGGAQMFGFDVDGDGDTDVVSSLNAHEWGLSWFENQQTDSRIRFKEHRIMGTRAEEAQFGVAFSQPHALAIADLNGDGLTDIVTGKRRWAHGPDGDVEPGAAPVVYWFEQQRLAGGGSRFVPHLIDDASGVGVQIALADIDQDGRIDVLTTSKLGAFVFRNRLSGADRR